jgi:hypothetical protein
VGFSVTQNVPFRDVDDDTGDDNDDYDSDGR